MIDDDGFFVSACCGGGLVVVVRLCSASVTICVPADRPPLMIATAWTRSLLSLLTTGVADDELGLATSSSFMLASPVFGD